MGFWAITPLLGLAGASALAPSIYFVASWDLISRRFLASTSASASFASLNVWGLNWFRFAELVFLLEFQGVDEIFLFDFLGLNWSWKLPLSPFGELSILILGTEILEMNSNWDSKSILDNLF